MAYQVGILPVSNSLAEVLANLERYLPPGHAVLATRQDPDVSLTYYLLEGPLLPESEEIKLAQPVSITVRLHTDPKTNVTIRMARFNHRPNDAWQVNP